MYIGRQPIIGNFVKLDTITTSATTTFNLTNGGVAYYPQSANNCLVSLNGILQAPTDSYTISGSTIVFSSALTTSDVIDFIIVLGDVLNIGTPSDNTVSLAKLTATGTKDSTTFLRGDNTFATAGGTNTPAFSVYRNATQSITAGVVTKIQFNTEEYDTNNAFDSSTNYRFTVPSGKAGKYFFTINATITQDTQDSNRIILYIYKNGSVIARVEEDGAYDEYTMGYSLSTCSSASEGDYYEGYVFQGNSNNDALNLSANTYTRFSGFKIIE
jgi:hypothetical protein